MNYASNGLLVSKIWQLNSSPHAKGEIDTLSDELDMVAKFASNEAHLHVKER